VRVDGATVVELVGLPRPFVKLRALDLDEVVASAVAAAEAAR
jgi:hypothetical protein